jgi:hypothetical protein
MSLKVKSIEHLKELADIGVSGDSGHFEGYLKRGFLHQNIAIYYEKDKDSWEIVNESDDFENEYDSTEEMRAKEDHLMEGLEDGALWKYY